MTDLDDPKVRIFFSIDLTGSTRFKTDMVPNNIKTEEIDSFQRDDILNMSWLEPFARLPIAFERYLAAIIQRYHTNATYESIKKDLNEITSIDSDPSLTDNISQSIHEFYKLCSPRFCRWKLIGDEVIYMVWAKDPLTVPLACSLWSEALSQFLNSFESQSWNKGINRPRLSVKSAIWLAGFPLLNAQFPISNPFERAGQQLATPQHPDFTFTDNLSQSDFDIEMEERRADDGAFFANIQRLGRKFSKLLDLELKTIDNLSIPSTDKKALRRRTIDKAIRSLEFIGPAMDHGFRLSEISEESKIYYSIDIAYIMLNIYKSGRKIINGTSNETTIRLYNHIFQKIFNADYAKYIRYIRSTPIKGIDIGVDYPVIASALRKDGDTNAKQTVHSKVSFNVANLMREPSSQTMEFRPEHEKLLEIIEDIIKDRTSFPIVPFFLQNGSDASENLSKEHGNSLSIDWLSNLYIHRSPSQFHSDVLKKRYSLSREAEKVAKTEDHKARESRKFEHFYYIKPEQEEIDNLSLRFFE